MLIMRVVIIVVLMINAMLAKVETKQAGNSAEAYSNLELL